MNRVGSEKVMPDKPSADLSGRRAHKRRAHARAVVDWPVTVVTSKATYQGKTKNASRGGALIHLAHELDIGENVRLAIEIPECQDAIIARAEVVRVFPLKRGVGQPYSHGMALQFTEIFEDNLKFFSGNLASDWKEDFSEIDPSPGAALPRRVEPPRSNKFRKYALGVLAVIILLPLLYLLSISREKKADSRQMVAQLEKRLLIIELQVESYQSVNESLVHFKEELANLQTELSALKKNLPAAETLESMSLQLKNQSELVQQIFEELERYQKPAVTDSKIDQHAQKENHYVVKKGDTLYQISTKLGISVGELRALNGLDANDPIIPGQKLMIQ